MLRRELVNHLLEFDAIRASASRTRSQPNPDKPTKARGPAFPSRLAPRPSQTPHRSGVGHSKAAHLLFAGCFVSGEEPVRSSRQARREIAVSCIGFACAGACRTVAEAVMSTGEQLESGKSFTTPCTCLDKRSVSRPKSEAAEPKFAISAPVALAVRPRGASPGTLASLVPAAFHLAFTSTICDEFDRDHSRLMRPGRLRRPRRQVMRTTALAMIPFGNGRESRLIETRLRLGFTSTLGQSRPRVVIRLARMAENSQDAAVGVDRDQR